ncbi:MAG TPA: phosphoglycerate dehydrogenase [Candidatus Limiplasma sp.]|jgi:D-3-phosphoglycerate dehydrogenase|nr:phosphoglycerate dehydrogenase [Candidatus Limiplasma sp.]HPR77160.1 phosphoglycerate dehydrogenase [Candidatus Limiplasma sp.]
MFKIQTLNEISDVIHQCLSAEKYLVAREEPVPDGILVRSATMHDMAMKDNLLAIARAGAGTNNIPVEECNRRGIVVFNTPGANANAVAELVACALMLGSRNVTGGVEWVKTLKGKGEEVPKLVEKGKNQFVGPEVRGKTLGVVGLGAIGAIVANTAAQGFGMEVLGYDPFISVESAWSLSRSIKRCNNRDDILAESDYLTLHVPLTEKTTQLINAASIAKMKDGVHLLNFSRGELVDTAAVKAALESGKIASYVTDFPTEELIGVKNAVLIPHLGASTPESEENCARMAACELRDYLEIGQIRNSVNFPEILLDGSDPNRLLVIHENVPSMVSAISAAIGARHINIDNMQNKSRKEIAVTVIGLDDHPDEKLTEEIRSLPGVIRVRTFEE